MLCPIRLCRLKPIRCLRSVRDSPLERETGIEPAPSAWKAEVLPLNYSRIARTGTATLDGPNLRTCHRPCQARLKWWREVDSNHRRREPADLQSAPVGRLGIPPNEPCILYCVRPHVNAQMRCFVERAGQPHPAPRTSPCRARLIALPACPQLPGPKKGPPGFPGGP